MKSFTTGLAGVLLAGLGLAGLTAAAEPRAGLPDKGTQDVVFFAEDRPLLLRFRVRIDDKPLEVAWDAYMDKLFRYLDVDGDGVLSKEEALRAPAPQALFSNTPFFVGGRLTGGLGRRDGKMSRADLADYYRRSGATPFQFRLGDSGPRDGVVRILAATGQVMGATPSAEALNDRLFALLDTDKDGKLSRAEMAAAPRILAKLDADDDEMVTATELLGTQSVGGTGGFAAVAFSPDGRMLAGQVSGGPFQVVSGRNDAALAKRLLSQYGVKGARKLTAKALGLDKAALDRLDADGDGELDAEELARFAERAPDLEFRVDLLKGRGQQVRIEHVKRGTKADRLVVAGKNGLPVLDLNTTRVELTVPVRVAMATAGGPNVRQQFINQFKMADMDNKGYLDMESARANRLFGNAFQMMDRDGDGKLYLKEVVAYFDAMTELSDLATASVVTMSVSDQGASLFDLLDTDKDGRLSVRELRQLPKLLAEFDRNGDGELARSEVPRNYRATFELGPANPQTNVRRAIVVRGGPPDRPIPRRTEGPLWFRKMDRNRDGDVSRREFLGSDEEFRRIDTDGDGLISAEEATAFDRRLREPAVPDTRRR